MADLIAAEFPFLVGAPLMSLVRSDQEFLAQAQDRALEADLEASEGTWLVASGPRVETLMDILWDVCKRGFAASDPVVLSYAPLLHNQLHLARTYRVAGFRDGLCVPWATKQVYTSRTAHIYKTHLSRVYRDEIEPWKLSLTLPLCKGYIRSPGDYVGDVEITCGMCKRLKARDPEIYRMAVSPGEN